MKRFLIVVCLLVLGKVGYDAIMRNIEKRNGANLDARMEKLADEMDAKTPVEGPLFTITKVEYSERVLRFRANITSGDLSGQNKARITGAARTAYCSNPTFVKAKVGVEYEFFGPPRGYEDLTRERWTLPLPPTIC